MAHTKLLRHRPITGVYKKITKNTTFAEIPYRATNSTPNNTIKNPIGPIAALRTQTYPEDVSEHINVRIVSLSKSGYRSLSLCIKVPSGTTVQKVLTTNMYYIIDSIRRANTPITDDMSLNDFETAVKKIFISKYDIVCDRSHDYVLADGDSIHVI
jgi:hypothetical protein